MTLSDIAMLMFVVGPVVLVIVAIWAGWFS